MVDLVVSLDTARSGEVLCFVYTMGIKTDLWTRVHSPVVRAAHCRSAGRWFNSWWRHWIHTHWHFQRNNIMSPITITITMPITTIRRKSVNKKSKKKQKAKKKKARKANKAKKEKKKKKERHHRASGGLLCSSQGCYDDCSGVGHEGPCSTENSYSTEERTRSISTVHNRSQDSNEFFLVDCPQATERFRSRHRGGPKTRTTYRRVAGQAQYDPTEPQAAYSTGRGSVDHRHHRFGDDGENSR